MSSSPASRLWDPAVGIRFAPRQDAVVYPVLDLSRVYSTGTTHGQSEPSLIDEEPLGSSPRLNLSGAPGPSDGIDFDSEAESVESGQSTIEVPVTSLEYNISPELFKKAKNAKEGSPESFWSYTMYRGPIVDGVEKRVKVHYCKTKHSTEKACQYFLNEKVIGFDLEWEADATADQGPKRNVSLIQIASPSRIGLFHVAQFPARDVMVAPSFKKLMEDPGVTKAGVAIRNDATRLSKFLKIESRGLFELSHLYRLVKYSSIGMPRMVNKKLVPLARQVEEYLGLPLFKGQDVRSSKWSKSLNMSQILYSASDAYVGLQLYYALEKEREALDPCPPRPFHAELDLPIRLSYNVTAPNLPSATEVTDSEAADGDTAVLEGSPAALVKRGDVVAGDTTGSSTKRRVKKPKLFTTSTASNDSRVAAAENWVIQYRASKTEVIATPAQLRSYRIWHENPNLDPGAIAKILRDPPLHTTTVAGYILKSITSESLPYDRARLQTQVFSVVSKPRLESLGYKDLYEAAKEDGSSHTPNDLNENAPSL
ncbi:hypothetical protein jhhlp_002564 [Lomentospora prolificans]|uniref:3'-5' exonuclease domain-containing protein n=1 Tax=Lomentospora prolificans TaxID=41688 RepID=A0A2N3NEI7_9PEZI|nr:hypothetical protein jhhlp_002564 [Lomentospora prolificans]